MQIPDQAVLPAELNDRAVDNWEPLAAIADTAGGPWPMSARGAALALSGAVDVEDERPAIRLLADLRALFTDPPHERLATKTILEALHGERFEESGWDDWGRGRGLKAEGLAWLLRPFGIRARQMKLDGEKVRGFDVDQFTDAFARYLPPPPTDPLARYPAPDEGGIVSVSTGVPAETPTAGKGNGAVPPTFVDPFDRHPLPSAAERSADDLVQRILDRTGGELIDEETPQPTSSTED